jgi:sulfoxide reductase heme-binding subunit YedZ
MPVTLAAAGPSALWYLTRATGAVTLVLLTLTVALGIANSSRAQTQHWPRFVVEGLHRNVSLLAIAVLVVHILTTVLDPFAAISLLNSIIPFTGNYRPIWLGLGTLASDLLVALALTSIIRRRLGQRTWRATHWLAYLCWPVAVLHGLGTGSDARSWLGVLTAACVLSVMAAIWARAAYGWQGSAQARLAAVAASVGLPVLLAVWAAGGPLARGWAARAGTPLRLLAHTTGRHAAAASGGQNVALPSLPLSTTVRGSVSETQTSSGIEVNISLASPIAALAALDVRIYGSPIEGGGVAMSASSVSAGTAAQPSRFSGVVTGLDGNSISARIGSSSDGVLSLQLVVSLDPSTGTASGTMTATR